MANCLQALARMCASSWKTFSGWGTVHLDSGGFCFALFHVQVLWSLCTQESFFCHGSFISLFLLSCFIFPTHHLWASSVHMAWRFQTHPLFEELLKLAQNMSTPLSSKRVSFVCVRVPETWMMLLVSLQFIAAVDHFSEVKGFEIMIGTESKAFAALLSSKLWELTSF